ncbi:hypothetical protein CDV55_105599 [Aspergillus turcosus]|nr:hypothetical protein CDV55_105599 [Aspergillus turcosus]
MGPSQQNHHYIPRFILRKFAPEDQPPAGPTLPPGTGSRKRNRNTTSRRDFLVNKIDLEKSVLTQRPVSTELALVDMYQDPGFDDNPYHLERKLSQLEGQAGNILKRAYEKFAEGSSLELIRIEVDQLRKFLFLMKYRNTGMFERYNHDHVDNYDADDRERMLRYMESKGFRKPRDVWFDNLRYLLDLVMDPGKGWRDTLQTQMYPDDAAMFDHHLHHSFMAFCRPELPEDEFLLTQNAFSIYEGPSTENINVLTGRTESVVYNEHHNFAPISPSLIIILRSHLLPLPGQSNTRPRTWDLLAAGIRSSHLYPDRAGSMLQDLPIHPCDTVHVRPDPDALASFHKNDKFQFHCFKLSSRHVAVINNLLLEEAYSTSSIVFHSRQSLEASIENYFEDKTDGLKHALVSPLENRVLYLTTLEKILRKLGGTARCKVKTFRLHSVRVHMSEHVAGEVAVQLFQNEETEGPLPWVYALLKPEAGRETFWYDIYQASLMMLLKIKVDAALGKSSLTDQEKWSARLHLQSFFMTFPTERLWLYLKIARNMDKFDLDDFKVQIAPLVLEEIEDKYAKFIAYFPTKRDYLTAMMFFQARR